MVKLINLTKTIKLFVCLLIVAFATNVSAQSYQRRTYQTDMGDAIVKGVGNLFKKKDKSQKSEKTPKNKDKASATKKTSAKQSKKSEDDVELIVSGDGSTKEQATLSALRSALEQTYGTFVSSNTKILNDKLIKDEIVSISTGNIKEYQYLNENEIEGKWYVTLKAIVSIGKLVQYVQSKGGETELAGATFANDVKLKRLYADNHELAFRNLLIQVKELVPKMFDYSIEVESPKAKSSEFICSATITITSNENYKNIRNMIFETLGALCFKSKEEVSDYHTKGIRTISVRFSGGKVPGLTYLYSDTAPAGLASSYEPETFYYALFSESDFFKKLESLIESFNGFIIDDGLKQTICTSKERWYDRIYLSNSDWERIYYNMGTAYVIKNYSGGKFLFPVEESVKYQIRGDLRFTLEELQKVNSIKVLPLPQNFKNNK